MTDHRTFGAQAIHSNPNVRQSLAANPDTSVWVSASAGTGKTKILTDRVLRLMLPRPGMEAATATAPDKILCLTFTKTAASEMADRIHERLSEWSIMSDDDLRDNLTKLLQNPPDTTIMEAARALFARVVDTPGGMKIMTLHSFCQSVLKRFPLEAGLPAHFEVLDERTAGEYLQNALRRIVEDVQNAPDSELARALTSISTALNADQFQSLMQDITRHRSDIRILKKRFPTLHDMKAALMHGAGFNSDISSDKYLDEYGAPDNAFLDLCRTHLNQLIGSDKKTDQALGDILDQYCAAQPEKRPKLFDFYANGFLTLKKVIRAKIVTKAISDKSPAFAEALNQEAQRLFDIHEKMKALQIAQMTYDLMVVGFEMVSHYTATKSASVQLDFDDLVDYTEQLLSDPTQAAWVLFKMDRGIDHILVDEAQDTSPAQWSVVRAIAGDFFSGIGARDDTLRTIFVVGDEKQSIFSFQGADPAGFQTMRQYFDERVTQAGLAFTPVNLLRSFRSTIAVLKTVDHVFSAGHILQGVQTDLTTPLKHEVHWTGQAGRIEVWPLIAADDPEPPAPWTPPIEVINSDNADVKLAATIADEIGGWLDRAVVLPSKGRPIKPGDIMILFRSRGKLLDHILRALKDRDIPVSGIDRMVLTEHLAVQDCLKMMEVGLLPQDDLSLATILKSPFIGYDEKRLYDLAYGRSDNLWQTLKTKDPDTYTYIRQLTLQARTKRPFDFMQSVLVTPCPADPNSGRRALYARLGQDIDDALNELLNAALDFEQLHNPQCQSFLSWFARGEAEVKREQDSSDVNQVRLMTVHASKGLQAPIVFLPDTTSLPRNIFQIIWPQNPETDLPLWAARADGRDESLKDAVEGLKAAQLEEYRRLLYVALTRAEDRLYICGSENRSEVKDDTWYGICRNMITHMDGVQTAPFVHGGDRFVFENPQTAEPRNSEQESAARMTPAPMPQYLQNPPPAEPSPPRPLAPSRPSNLEPAIRSPLAADDSFKFKRGNIIHQLLQYLPELPPEKRQNAAAAYLSKPAFDLSNHEQSDIQNEILRILNAPDYAALFSQQSRAEVPIVGLVENLQNHDYYAVSAQIDRMIVEEGRIMIVDYKTNRPPPTKVADVQDVYWKQMAAYQTVLEKIYPDKQIECYLLWTDGPNLMHLPNENLKKHRKT